jgi:Flp pilus assembly protein protease CpaA
VTGPEAFVTMACAVAVGTDLAWRKIPNWLTFSMVIVGVVNNVMLGQPLVGFIGVLVAFALHLPLYALGVEKGGDAKLLIGIAAVVGWSPMVETTIWRYALMLPVGLLVLTAMGKLPNLVANLRWLSQGRAGPRPPVTWMPFAPVIFGAWLVSVFTSWAEIR